MVVKKRKISLSRGFSLIELLVAVTILAILTTIGLVNYRTSLRRARDARRQADLDEIRGALEIYKADNDEYPDSTNCLWGYHWPDCFSFGTTDWIPELVPNYIPRLPDDIKRNDSYIGDPPHTFSYNYRALPQNCDNSATKCARYHLLTQLEYLQNSAINGTQFGYTGPAVYVVTNP